MDLYNLFLSMFFSTVGFSYLLYGKKIAAPAFMLAGAALMFYGYFIDTLWLTLTIGLILSAAPFFLK